MFSAQNGARVAALWQGNTGGYESASEADLSLAHHLVWWTGRDAARADRLFRLSGLFRDKWDRAYGDGSTYGSRTIDTAIAGCDSCFREDDRFRKIDVGVTVRVRVA
jgi:putative DNA primase/helicase